MKNIFEQARLLVEKFYRNRFKESTELIVKMPKA